MKKKLYETFLKSIRLKKPVKIIIAYTKINFTSYFKLLYN